MATRMFNVRVEKDLEVAIEAAAAREGVRKSVWAREVMAAFAYGGVSLREIGDLIRTRSSGSPHPARFLALQGNALDRAVEAGECRHPPTAVKQLPFTDVCGLCGTVVKTR